MAIDKIEVSFKDSEIFRDLLGEITKITSDPRISMGVRNEYIARFQDVINRK